MREIIKEKHMEGLAAGYAITLDVYPVGEDILAVLKGGDRPHIGCSVLAVPRESLSGDGSSSCTSSVINVTGHKDEAVCRHVAESICRKYGAVTVCTGGIHADGISADEIDAVLKAVRELTVEI